MVLRPNKFCLFKETASDSMPRFRHLFQKKNDSHLCIYYSLQKIDFHIFKIFFFLPPSSPPNRNDVIYLPVSQLVSSSLFLSLIYVFVVKEPSPIISSYLGRRHDTQHDDTQRNDTHHDDTQHCDTQHFILSSPTIRMTTLVKIPYSKMTLCIMT
jgi:hypothetical protein